MTLWLAQQGHDSYPVFGVAVDRVASELVVDDLPHRRP